jgi:nucleoside-diphosphate kinase
MEKTLVLVKPDAIQRGLIGDIIHRFERKGLKIVGLKMMRLEEDLIQDHYGHLADKPFFPEIRDFMTSSPLVALCIEGLDAVQTVRDMTGVTLSREAQPGTIRGDFGMSIQCNLVHASDSLESAKVEVKRFFNDDEVFAYGSATDVLIYAAKERE